MSVKCIKLIMKEAKRKKIALSEREAGAIIRETDSYGHEKAFEDNLAKKKEALEKLNKQVTDRKLFRDYLKDAYPEATETDILLAADRTKVVFEGIGYGTANGKIRYSAQATEKAWGRWIKTGEEMGERGGRSAFDFGIKEFEKNLRDVIDERQAPEEIKAEDLSVGDKFTIEGEKYEVKKIDPDTEIVTIKDGETIKLKPQQELKIDRGSLKHDIDTEAPLGAKYGDLPLEDRAGLLERNVSKEKGFLSEGKSEADKLRQEEMFKVERNFPQGKLQGKGKQKEGFEMTEEIKARENEKKQGEIILDSLGFQTIYEALDGYVKSGKPQEGIEHLTMLGKSVYAEGKTTLQDFTQRMKEHLGKLWDSFKDMIKSIYNSVKAFNERLGERGSIGRGETAPSKIADLFEADLSKLSKDELKSYLRTSIEAGQKSYREGKREEGDKYKEKVLKFMRRAKKLRAIRDSLYLTDKNLQKISKKNPLLLSNYEFHLYLKDVQQKAVELSENKLQKAMLLQRIWEKDLNHVDNYRKVLKLPTIAEMTTAQVNEFADIIEGFEQGDTFLGERALDVIENYTDWAGIATWREAKEKLAKSLNIPLEKLETIDINEFDMTKGDYSLSQRHPLLNLYVHEFWTKKVVAMQKYYDFEKKLNELAKKSALSRKRTLVEKLIPQDKQIFNFIEAEDKKAASENMTPEQIDYAHFIQQTFHDAYEYLIEHKVLGGSRFVSDSLEVDTEKAIDDTYITHMRRGFLEALKDDGLIRAFQEIKDAKKDNIAYVNIIDNTGNILPYEKWFKFAMYRTGEIVPSQNVTAIVLSYMKQFYLKQSLDETVVKLSLYARMLTPEGQTKGGLDLDPKLIDFTNKWVNSKKGRKVSIGGFMIQGGYVDTALTGLMTLTRIFDLGFHPIVAPLSMVGEQLSTLQNLGMSDYLKGKSRLKTEQGKKIVSQYTEIIGKKMWEQLTEPDKLFSDRFNTAAFGFFGLANRKANETHLLGALTDEEFKTGVISAQRQAEIKIDINKYRIVEGMQSIIGMTSIARATLQYRSWAVPHLTSVLRNIENINEKTSREELIRLVTISGTVLVIGALTSPDDDDKTLYAEIYRKALREALSLFGSLDPEFWFASPRVITWLQQLSKNIKMIITLEEYKEKKRKGQLKGVEGLKRQFTPAPIRALKTKE